MLVDFGMGATIENFHRSGSLPQRTEHLKSTVMEGVMLEAVDFSMSADILSGQQASDLFIALMDFKNFLESFALIIMPEIFVFCRRLVTLFCALLNYLDVMPFLKSTFPFLIAISTPAGNKGSFFLEENCRSWKNFFP